MIVVTADVTSTVTKAILRAVPWVKDVKFREALTPDGSSAVVVYLVAPAKARELRNAAKLDAAAAVVQAAFNASGIQMWPYVRFVAADEQRRAGI